MSSKVCSRCKEEKDRAVFSQRRRSRDGLHPWCKACEVAYARERYAENAEVRARLKARYEQPKVKSQRNAAALRWQKRNPEKRKLIERNCNLKRDYGIDLAEYNRLLAEQDGKCACCCKASKKILNVDHCHTENFVRGLICYNCNRGLGLLGDNLAGLELAVAYLKRQVKAHEPFTFIA